MQFNHKVNYNDIKNQRLLRLDLVAVFYLFHYYSQIIELRKQLLIKKTVTM